MGFWFFGRVWWDGFVDFFVKVKYKVKYNKYESNNELYQKLAPIKITEQIVLWKPHTTNSYLRRAGTFIDLCAEAEPGGHLTRTETSQGISSLHWLVDHASRVPFDHALKIISFHFTMFRNHCYMASTEIVCKSDQQGSQLSCSELINLYLVLTDTLDEALHSGYF